MLQPLLEISTIALEEPQPSLASVAEGSGNGYRRTVCDYGHLNLVRTKLLN